MTITNLSELAETIDREVRDVLRIPALDACRSILRESGIRAARRSLAEAPSLLSDAQQAYREAQAVEQSAREAYGQALTEADWTLDGKIHSEGNKRYRWIPCDCVADTVLRADANCPVCKGDGKYRRFMLADDVKAWKAAEAAKVPAVVEAAAALRTAEENTAAARDLVALCEKKLSARKADLAAAVAELQALSIGLAAKENAR